MFSESVPEKASQAKGVRGTGWYANYSCLLYHEHFQDPQPW